MTLNFQFNNTQLNQTDTFEPLDQPNDQLGLWFSLGISIMNRIKYIQKRGIWMGSQKISVMIQQRLMMNMLKRRILVQIVFLA